MDSKSFKSSKHFLIGTIIFPRSSSPHQEAVLFRSGFPLIESLIKLDP
jgi:hypothetical protein